MSKVDRLLKLPNELRQLIFKTMLAGRKVRLKSSSDKPWIDLANFSEGYGVANAYAHLAHVACWNDCAW